MTTKEFIDMRLQALGKTWMDLVNEDVISNLTMQQLRDGTWRRRSNVVHKLCLFLQCTAADLQATMVISPTHKLSQEAEKPEGAPVKRKRTKKPDAEPELPAGNEAPKPWDTVSLPGREAADENPERKPCRELTEEEKRLNGVDSFEELKRRQHPEGGLHLYNVRTPDPKPEPDTVNHPAHYQLRGFPDGFETIDVIAAVTADMVGMEAVCTANALKYLIRWKHKNGAEDLKKARWYLDRLIGEV